MYLTHYCGKILVPRAGLEPTLAVPKTAVLPLHNLGIGSGRKNRTYRLEGMNLASPPGLIDRNVVPPPEFNRNHYFHTHIEGIIYITN